MKSICFHFITLLFVVSNTNGQKTHINIGALFENNSFYEENIGMLRYAVDAANDIILEDSGIKLSIADEPFAFGYEYTVPTIACNLLEHKIGVMFGPQTASSAYHIMNICDAKEIPYINLYMEDNIVPKTAVLNMHPSLDSMAMMLLDYVNATGWDQVTFLVESSQWLKRIANIMENNNRINNRIQVRNLDYRDFHTTFQDIRDSDDTNLILDCTSESLPTILRQAMQVGLMTKNYNWVLTNFDGHSIDFEPYQYSGTNITVIRMLNMSHAIFPSGVATTDSDDGDDLFIDPEVYAGMNDADERCATNDDNNFFPEYPEKLTKVVSFRASLIYDAVMVFATAIRQLGKEQVMPISLRCDDSMSAWNKGLTVLNYMKNVNYDGITGKIEFDNSGMRSNISIEILRLESNRLEIVGNWKNNINPSSRLSFIQRSFSPLNTDYTDNSLKNKTLTIITALSEPYTMLKLEAETLTGNDRFEGYAIDLIFEMSLLLEFSYTFVVEEDKDYGEFNGKTWTGMIGKVINEEADIAITDLTVTSERIKALDFTPSIMNLGISILYQIPRKKAPTTFSFMAPYDTYVWIIMGVAYLLVSICFFCLGRISPSQWENRFPCIEEPAYLENQFSFQNSLWFAAGAILQQGSEIEVKAPSVRLASAFWWFFTVIIMSMYTANLTAFLVAESRDTLIRDIRDFAECGLPHQPKCKAFFGAKRHGSTFKFFKESSNEGFNNMFKVMTLNDSLLVDENIDGLRRVQNENYAFLMESASLQYFTERECNVTMVGDLIDDRIHAIGMRKKYKYYNALSEGVLRLQERGVMEKLHTKWWRAKRGGGACDKKETTNAESLKLDHLEGVFLVLTIGIISALLYGIGDILRRIRKRAKQGQVSFLEELKIEYNLLLKSLFESDQTRPVRSWSKPSSPNDPSQPIPL